MSNFYEFNLTTLSPVYIGCRENVSPYSDYIYKNDKVHFIDEKKLIKYFRNSHNIDKIMDDYIKTIKSQASSNMQDRYNLESFFEKYGLELEDFTSYSLETNAIITQSINKTINSSGRPYIPGSSLKGAIRTCIIYYHLVKKNIKPKGGSPYIGQDILGSFSDDKLKYLSVSDTDTVEGSECQVLKTLRFNLKNKSQDMPIVVEAIKPNTVFNFSINLKGNCDEEFDYINKLLGIVNKFNKNNIIREIDVLEKNKNPKIYSIINFYQELYNEIEKLEKENNSAIMRVGGGKTFFDNTILLTLSKEERNKIIVTGNKNKKINRDKNFFPKTRAFIGDKKQFNGVLGWTRIDLK